MKISFSTLGCPDWTWQKIVEYSADLHFDGIEIRGIENEMYNPRISYFNEENREAALKDLKQKKLEIVSLDTSARFNEPDRFDSSIAEAKETMDLAEKLGVKYIRVFGDKIPDIEKREEILDRIASGLEEIYRYSEDKQVTPLLEVHGHFNNIEIFKDLLKRLNHPKFAVLWDIEHSYKVYEENYLEFFGFIRPYVKLVHIKDVKKVDGEWKLCGIGQGVIPIPGIINLLAATNYDGYVSLEWEKKWHPELDDSDIAFSNYMSYMRKILYRRDAV